MRLLLLLCILSLPLASAATVDLHIDLGSDGYVKEEFIYIFGKPYNESFTQIIDGQIQNVSVTAMGETMAFSTDNGTGDTLLTILPDIPVDRLSISFVRSERIFSNADELQFFTELSLNRNLVRNMSAWVTLPPGHGARSYTPQMGTATSDGQHIVIEWEGYLLDDIEVISVQYAPLIESGASVSRAMVIGAGALFALLVCGAIMYARRRVRQSLLKGFREDEQKSLVYIRDKGKIFQKDLQKEFSFSRAKCTRIVKKLEERGIVEKKSAGRTNRIVWRG